MIISYASQKYIEKLGGPIKNMKGTEFKFKDIEKALNTFGYFYTGTAGSHSKFADQNGNSVSVVGTRHNNIPMNPFTLMGSIKRSPINWDDFSDVLFGIERKVDNSQQIAQWESQIIELEGKLQTLQDQLGSTTDVAQIHQLSIQWNNTKAQLSSIEKQYFAQAG